MGLKAFDMLVLPSPDDTVQRLQDSAFPPTQIEIKAIQDIHQYLWMLEVFVDPRVIPLESRNEKTRKLAGAIQQEIGLPNEAREFRGLVGHELTELEHEAQIDLTLKKLKTPNVTHPEYLELKELSRRHEENILDEIRKYLLAKGYKLE